MSAVDTTEGPSPTGPTDGLTGSASTRPGADPADPLHSAATAAKSIWSYRDTMVPAVLQKPNCWHRNQDVGFGWYTERMLEEGTDITCDVIGTFDVPVDDLGPTDPVGVVLERLTELDHVVIDNVERDGGCATITVSGWHTVTVDDEDCITAAVARLEELGLTVLEAWVEPRVEYRAVVDVVTDLL